MFNPSPYPFRLSHIVSAPCTPSSFLAASSPIPMDGLGRASRGSRSTTALPQVKNLRMRKNDPGPQDYQTHALTDPRTLRFVPDMPISALFLVFHPPIPPPVTTALRESFCFSFVYSRLFAPRISTNDDILPGPYDPSEAQAFVFRGLPREAA